MKKYNICANLIRVIKNVHDKANSAVLFSSSIGDWFRTTVGVRQGCLLSPTLFSIFLERTMTAYGMEISAEKIKLMTNNTSGINTGIKINGQELRQSQASSTWAQL